MLKNFYTKNLRRHLCKIIDQTIYNIKISKVRQQVVFNPHIDYHNHLLLSFSIMFH